MEDMADFFDNLMRDAKKTAARVADRTMATANIAKNKTLETVDCVKLEIEMKKVQGNLDKEYQVLGQIVYQIERGKLNRDDQILQAACKRIDHCFRQLEELENKKRGKKHPEAEEKKTEEEKRPEETEKTESASQDVFEGYERDEDGYPMMKFCPSCKAGNPPDAKVCVNCHQEL